MQSVCQSRGVQRSIVAFCEAAAAAVIVVATGHCPQSRRRQRRRRHAASPSLEGASSENAWGFTKTPDCCQPYALLSNYIARCTRAFSPAVLHLIANEVACPPHVGSHASVDQGFAPPADSQAVLPGHKGARCSCSTSPIASKSGMLHPIQLSELLYAAHSQWAARAGEPGLPCRRRSTFLGHRLSPWTSMMRCPCLG